MGLRLLGPLELVAGQRVLDLGGPRQRVVLAMLALNANRVTPVDQLIDAVWDDSPPSTARGQIQTSIYGLRKLVDQTGGGTTIHTRSPGYLLEIAVGELDSAEFATLVSTAREHVGGGRTEEAAAALRAALDLWRGPALAGVESDLVLRSAARLEDNRFAAIEERIRLDLDLRRHEQVIGELAELIEAHPLRERLYELQMLALYRSGRQADALEAARKARRALVAELGIDPGRALQDLERAILNCDPVLDLPATATGAPTATTDRQPAVARQVVPRQLPGSIADFTGREDNLADIKQIVADAGNSPYGMRIVAISGKGGVGKSTLAIRVAHELGDDFPDGHLYAHVPAHRDDPTGSLLGRFLRALGVAGTAVPEDVQERAEMYRTGLASKRLLVVLDDVTAEEQVLPLLPGSSTCLVIVTSRVRLSGLPGAHHVDVDELDTDTSMKLFTTIVGVDRVAAEQDAAMQLVNFCAGLPLALRIAGARLASRPHWRIAELVRRLGDEVRRLDEFAHRGLELRSNIGLTYRGLPDTVQRLFRLVALTRAEDFPGWTAAALLDTSVAEAEEVLEMLVDAQVLDTVDYPGEELRYRFHSLIRVYALEQLMQTETRAERKEALTRLLGAWLALADDAHRREYGGDFTILHGGAPRWRPPDGVPLVRNPMDWWETERSSLVTAVRQAASAGLDELCWDLALTSVTLFESKGYFDDWRETASLALEVTTEAGNRTGRAATLYSFGTLHMFQKRTAEAQRCFAEALTVFDEDGNLHGRALTLRNVALVDGLLGDSPSMIANYEAALGMMREVGDRMGEAQILRSLASFWIDEGDIETGQPMLEKALQICKDVHCVRGEAQVVHRFAYLYLRTDQVELARQALNRVLLIVRDIGDRIGEAYALYGLGVVRRREGRLDSAETTLVHALSLARQISERLVEGQALYTLAEIDMVKGSGAAAGGYLTEAEELFRKVGPPLWHAKVLILRSEVHIGRGESALASADIDRAAGLLLDVESKEASHWRSHIETMRATLVTANS